MTINRQWLLKERPNGAISESNFEYTENPIPQPGDGEVLVQNQYLSFDPTYRGQMEDRPNYVPPIQIGDVMRGSSAGQVVQSNHPDFKEGDLVNAEGGWQDYFVAGRDSLSRIPDQVPLTKALSVYGVTGLTAYFGLLDVGKPQAGETVLVSGAAGATGSVVGQIAKIKGCYVVGIAGGPEKCSWLVEEANFDAAIDYKNENIYKRIGQLCPGGVNVYFENVGGEILEAALGCLAMGARIVLCGGISAYNTDNPPPGPRNLLALIGTRSRIEGFLLPDYVNQFSAARKELGQWIEEGKLVSLEDIQEGFENAPRTFMRLFTGENRGKQMLKL